MDIVHRLQQGDSTGIGIGHGTGTCSGTGTGDSTGTAASAQGMHYRLTADGLVRFRDRIYVSNKNELKKVILREFHVKSYSGHPGYQKTLIVMKRYYYWLNLKRDVAKFVTRCFDYQLVKAECKHSDGLLQPIAIPEWKWEVISMNFITGLPKTVKQRDSIMVIVDRLTKVAHFIPMKSTYSASNVAQVFIKDVVRLHGVPKKIVSERNAKSTSKFWKELFAGLGTELAFNTTYHPQTDGWTERINKILENMMRMYVMHQQRKWEEYLPLVEFSYNNGYQESLRMSPFEVMYEQNCNTSISWSDLVSRVLIGLDILTNMEQEMQVIKKNLKASQGREKSYADINTLFKELQVGKLVYLCIKPKKSSLRIGSCVKLAPRFCGPFSIIERIGPLAYRLALPTTMKVYDVFHVYLLKNYVKDVDHVIR